MAHKLIDIICKTTLEDHTADMVRFYYPELETILDFSRGFEWVNHELSDLNPDKEDLKDSIMPDSVLKAYTLSGEIIFIIIGIEFLGYYDPDFHKRLFKYYYRLFDKYGRRVTLLPIYTNPAANRSPSVFNYSFLQTDLHFRVKPYKVWEQNEDELLQSNNPYAFVMLIINNGRKGEREQRLAKGIALAETICNKGFSEKDKANLLKFMRLYFNFENTELQLRFDTAIHSLTNKPKIMGIIELDKKWAVEEANIRTARNLLKMGLHPNDIHKATELPLKEIMKLVSQ